MSTVKRFFFYAVAIINLGIFAAGVGTLLKLVFDILFRTDSWRDFAQAQLSMGLAMLVIGGILWFLFWRIISRSVSGNKAEAGAGIRKFYLNLILTVSAITGLNSLAAVLFGVISWSSFSEYISTNLAAMIVAVCLWLYHTKVENSEGQPSFEAKMLRRWYVYILSGFGLVTLAVSSIGLVNNAVFNLPLWETYSVQGGDWHVIIGSGVSRILIGGLAWWYFWFRLAKDDFESTLRQVYLYLLTITGGAVAALVAVTFTLYKLLSFTMDNSAGTDFRYLAWTVPTMLVTAGIWMFHRKVVEEEAEHLIVNRRSPQRLYLYLMSFIGLGTMLTGLVYLFSLLLGLIFDSMNAASVFAAGWWSNQLSLSLALLLVGVPVWLYCWRKILRMTGAGDVTERSARSRRIFLYTVLGISIIAAVTVLVIIVYQIINGFLRGEFDSEFLRNMVWSLSVLFAAVPVLVYHWRLLREDQHLGAEKAIRRKKVVVLAGENAAELVTQIEKRLGYQVRKLKYSGESAIGKSILPDEELEPFVEKIAEAEGNGVILDMTGETVRMLPYRED